MPLADLRSPKPTIVTYQGAILKHTKTNFAITPAIFTVRCLQR